MLGDMRWTVLIPIKSLPHAKSRLAPASADAESHARLVEAIRADTVAAAEAAAGVARVVLVTDTEPAAAGRVVQSGTGLNDAVRSGAAHAVRFWPGDGVAALVGDLPALRAAELDAALTAAADLATGFVVDASGRGTTLLTATPGHAARPEFGPGSAARHAAHAGPLPAGPGLRLDVDTTADLQSAADALGLGPATTSVLGELGVTTRLPEFGSIAL